MKKSDCKRAQTQYYDDERGMSIPYTKQVPVLIVYSVGNKRYQRKPFEHDISLLERIEVMKIPFWYPENKLPNGYNTEQPQRSHGINSVSQFYWKRGLYVASVLYSQIVSSVQMFAFTGSIMRATMMNRIHVNNYFNGGGGWNAGYLKGALYIPSIPIETSLFKLYYDRVKAIVRALNNTTLNKGLSIISTQSGGRIGNLPDKSVDYIFTDPPFGGNLNYSELSFIWEAWLKVVTNSKPEAVVNPVQGKSLLEYKALITRCFEEYYRVLKPGRWMTIEFHNSKNSVWNAIQEALQCVGFIIADVRTLDKKQHSFKQVTTTSAVKQYLVISAYKPRDSFKREFIAKAGSADTAWAFVRQHLENLPVIVVKDGKVEVIVERQPFLLFDRMVAYHIINNIPVPLDSADFYIGLNERFLERDGMYFLSDQVNAYDNTRIENEVEPIQFDIRVTNEKTAIAWLYQQLGQATQTYAELQPKFMQEVKTVDRYEAMPELSLMLDESFLRNENGKWYIPDITKASDVAKLREKKLIKEFQSYLGGKGKLRAFRIEAIRAGFAKLWAEKNFKLIVETADRLPESVITEDDKLLMYVDLSNGRL